MHSEEARPFTFKLRKSANFRQRYHKATRGGSEVRRQRQIIFCVVRLAVARLLLNDTAALDATPMWRFRLEWQHRKPASFSDFGLGAFIAQFGLMQPYKTLKAWLLRQPCVACRLLVCRLHEKKVGCEHNTTMAGSAHSCIATAVEVGFRYHADNARLLS